jgi:hypothetical protein
MKKYIDNLKYQAQQNPLVAAGIGASLILAISKLLQANTNRKNANTWASEVERRRMMSR